MLMADGGGGGGLDGYTIYQEVSPAGGYSSQLEGASQSVKELAEAHDNTAALLNFAANGMGDSWKGEAAEAAKAHVQAMQKSIAQAATQNLEPSSTAINGESQDHNTLHSKIEQMPAQPDKQSLWDKINPWGDSQEDLNNQWQAKNEKNISLYSQFSAQTSTNTPPLERSFPDVKLPNGGSVKEESAGKLSTRLGEESQSSGSHGTSSSSSTGTTSSTGTPSTGTSGHYGSGSTGTGSSATGSSGSGSGTAGHGSGWTGTGSGGSFHPVRPGGGSGAGGGISGNRKIDDPIMGRPGGIGGIGGNDPSDPFGPGGAGGAGTSPSGAGDTDPSGFGDGAGDGYEGGALGGGSFESGGSSGSNSNSYGGAGGGAAALAGGGMIGGFAPGMGGGAGAGGEYAGRGYGAGTGTGFGAGEPVAGEPGAGSPGARGVGMGGPGAGGAGRPGSAGAGGRGAMGNFGPTSSAAAEGAMGRAGAGGPMMGGGAGRGKGEDDAEHTDDYYIKSELEVGLSETDEHGEKIVDPATGMAVPPPVIGG